jgi:hypothetical protein
MKEWSVMGPMRRIIVALAVCVGCKGGANAPPVATTPVVPDAAVVAAAPPARVLADPFAALLDERAGALLAAAKVGGERGPVMMRVIWQTVAAEPVARLETMAFLLPDGQVRWAVLAIERAPGAVEVTSGLVYPEGALAEGVRRPLAAAQGDCKLPMILLADVATLPAQARDDTFAGGYDLADACTIAGNAAGAAWVPSIDWFGVLAGGGDPVTFVSTVPRVEGAALVLGDPIKTAMPRGARTIVDAAGAPLCDDGERCFAIGERAALTEELPLRDAAYGRACELGRGLACIHLAGIATDPAAADALRARSVPAFRTACDAGEALECAYLGIAHEQGSGTARDEAAAARAYQRACDGDNALGCFNLGGLHREGRGVRRDAKRARTFYQRACDLGDAGGCDAAAATK